MASKLISKKQKNKKEKHTLSELKTLGHQLLSSRAHVNNLPLLLTYIKPSSSSSSPPQYVLESLLSLQSFFIPLLPDLPSSKPSLSSSQSDPDPEFIYRTWLRSKFDDFVHSLIDISVSSQSEGTLRELVLDTLMEFVRVGNGGKFHSAIYHKLLHSIIHSALGLDDILLDLLVSKYFKYIDVRYFTYISLEKLARILEAKDISGKRSASPDADNEIQTRESMVHSIHKLHHVLSHIPPLEELDENSEYQMLNGSGIFTKECNNKDHSELTKAEDKKYKMERSTNNVLTKANVAKKMKLKFTKAWISFLRSPLPLDLYKEVLVTLHQAVIPYLSNPIMLCDFLTRSYDLGGVISVMALSSLYVLLTQHGLEYPNFYEKLYALLEPSIFMAKHRAKFFQLLDSCLKSPLLPAYLAAAFTKKLSRLALSIPPSGALIIIALIHNLLRRHPSINCLIHQGDSDRASKEVTQAEKEICDGEGDSHAIMDMSSDKPGIDFFKNEESNPLKTNAMRSSLWEIDTLRHHYCPPVSRFVLSLENDLTVRAKTTEVAVKDFSYGSYATIFGEEIGRRVKQVPLAFYNATPTSLFLESDFPGWNFKFKSDEEPITMNEDENRTESTLEEHDHSFVKRQRIECS